MRSGLLLGLCLALAGCLAPPEATSDDDSTPPGDDDTTAGDDDTTPADADGDGFPEGEDCDDGDAQIHPGAEETCDGWPDDDCDGVLDPLEVDGDGDGYTECVGDCLDDDGAVHPGADETCDGWEDDDCDGVTDPREMDGDEDAASECDGDCDDGDPGASPGALETCDGLDNDCDGAPGGDEVDGDGDGWAPCLGDCDDADAGVHPGAAETCDGVDDDCDGAADDVGEAPIWYPDGDGDGYGDPAHPLAACEPPANHRGVGGDCDDGDGAVHPGAVETCGNGTDDDCDGSGGGCYPEGAISLADAYAFLAGTASGDEAGWALAFAGDVDGDGASDVVVGAPAAGAGGEGRAYGVLAPLPPGTTFLGSAWLTLAGGAANEYASYAVAAVDDVDGDGIGDVAVGAPGYGGGGGRVAFLSAGFAGETGTTADVDHALDGSGGDALGSSVSPAGDVDGDGHADWIVGAYLDDGAATNAGAACVVFGPWPGGAHAAGSPDLRTATFTGEAAQDGAGWWVSGAGDVDGDGTGDVLVSGDGHNGVGTDSGRGYLVYGPIAEGAHSLADADVILEGESAYDYAGYPLAAAGDVDGDGYGDVLAGAFAAYGEAPDSGRAYLLHGPLGAGIRHLGTADVIFLGEDAGDTAGLALAGTGDLNGDGLDDVVIGAERHDVGSADAGTAYLFYGPVPAGTRSLATADATISGVGASAFAGGALAGGADVTGDGHPDLLVGARGALSGGVRTGGVYVIAGGRI